MTNTLFDEVEKANRLEHAPLAVRMRPQKLEEVIGQKDAVGKGSWLRRAIESDTLSSVILYGPAGTGKTSIAHVIAMSTHAAFVEVSAVTGTVADLRREIKAAEQRLSVNNMRTILFIDEIHRFSRSQQDALLHAVEDRIIILVGATTENPVFEVNSALISRSRIVDLKPIGNEGVKAILQRALEDVRGLNGEYKIDADALDAIIMTAGGDARMALSTLEIASMLASSSKHISAKEVADAMPHRQLPYDKKGDNHYDIISAFIKSMRGSDPDAAVYWLARMLEAGEDPKFIARRIFILAAEDVGLADPRALQVGASTFKAVEVLGMPECRIPLAEAAIYMALAPKSNSAYLAIDAAIKEVHNGELRQVPAHLRDRTRPGSEKYGEYKYPHNYPNAHVKQQYLPDGLSEGAFYKPTKYGWEKLRFPDN